MRALSDILTCINKSSNRIAPICRDPICIHVYCIHKKIMTNISFLVIVPLPQNKIARIRYQKKSRSCRTANIFFPKKRKNPGKFDVSCYSLWHFQAHVPSHMRNIKVCYTQSFSTPSFFLLYFVFLYHLAVVVSLKLKVFMHVTKNKLLEETSSFILK